MDTLLGNILGSNVEDIVKNSILQRTDARAIIISISSKDDKDLCEISNKILDTSDLFTIEEYKKLDRNQQKQIYIIGHILKIKCNQLPEGKVCDMDELLTAMDNFYLGMKPAEETTYGGSKRKHKKKHKKINLDIFEEIGELTRDTKDTLKNDKSCDNTDGIMANIKSKISSIQSWCLQKLATSLFGQNIQNEAITFVTSLTVGAVVVNKPTEILHMLWKIVSLTNWGLPYVVKLYMTYFVGAFVNHKVKGIEFDEIKTEVVKNIQSIIILTNNNPTQLIKDSIPDAIKDAIDTVVANFKNGLNAGITDSIKHTQMQELKTAVMEGIQASNAERSMRIANVAFQTKKLECFQNTQQLTEAIIANPTNIEPTEKLLEDMLSTDGLDDDIISEIQEKLNTKRKREDPVAEEETGAEKVSADAEEETVAEEATDAEESPTKRPRLEGANLEGANFEGGKHKTRKQKKQSKKQKKQSKNKSKKQKKNRTRKARKVPIILDKGIEKKGKSSYKSCDTVSPGECATGCKPSWTDKAKISSRNWCHCNIDKTKCKKSLCPVHKK